MSGSNKKLSYQAPEAGSAVRSGALPAAEVQRVRGLIAGRHSKSAVELAKALHKTCGTAESEGLLLDAYQCRVGDLLKLGMAIEAKALLKMVSERFPASRLQLMDLQREVWAADGNIDEVVAPLQDPALPLEIRNRIEVFIRQRVYDLPALAAAASLPPDHTLRESAAALASALQAVTEGPVEDQVLALPQVSRRSPLAPWKAVVRAIACFYRREDEACKRWLRAIPNDSVPASLIPPLQAMLGIKAASEFRPSQQRLMAAAGGASAELHPALVVLEGALVRTEQKPLLEAARAALAVCDRCRPGIRERLRQHITIRCLARGIPRRAIGSAIGTPREDAYFYRLLATAFEHDPRWECRAEAVFLWEEFRRAAIHEKWFAANSLEDGVLLLHMAQLAEHVPSDLVHEPALERHGRLHRGNEGLGSKILLSAEALYERACRADPNPDAFQMWLNWAEKQRSWKVADQVAELWREARAADIQPLLYLTESAEQRGAYKKSLKHLEEAEKLDRVNPDVRRAKLRLLLSAAIRHLRQGKAHLVQMEIERIEALPEVHEGNVAALGAALRRICAALEQDFDTMRAQEQNLSKLLGGAVPALVLTNGLVKAANLDSRVQPPQLDVAGLPSADLLAGVAGACVLCDWGGLPLPLPAGWEGDLISALKQPHCPVEIPQLLVLGEAALRSQAERLAYGVSAVGLSGGAADSRFLFLRGRALPRWAFERREGCFSAALELARRERNTELAGRILDHLNGRPEQRIRLGDMNDPNIASRPMPPELLNEILAEEQMEKEFPISGRSRLPDYGAKLGPPPCDCPNCRAGRGEEVDEYEAREDFDLDEDEKVFGDLEETWNNFQELLDALPAGIARQLEEALARGEPPEVAAARILGETLPEQRPPARQKVRKTAGNLVPPKQGDLF